MSQLAHASRRLNLETLEDRFLLTACHVTRLADLPGGFDLGNGHARGSLRYCLNLANNNPGPDTIDFNVTGTIQLTSKLPTVTSDITITGPGADLLTVKGKGVTVDLTMLIINSGATVAISGLTITDGFNESIAGGIVNFGTLTLIDVTVSNNYWYFSGTDAYGGGIINADGATMTISGCTISGNEAKFADPQTYGGGIFNAGVMQVENSTISGNEVDTGAGAGIYNSGSLDIRFSTITANAGGAGPGIYNAPSAPAVFLYNTIVAGNIGGPDLVGSYTGSANLIGGDPMLGPLQYNGGHTRTHAVLAGSPAIDAGDNTGAPQWDQRGPGFPRIVNGTVDIGAFEVQSSPIPAPPHRLAVLMTADLEDSDPLA